MGPEEEKSVPEYKIRMLAEYKQLVDRRNKLAHIVHGYKTDTLDFQPSCPLPLLEAQLSAMDSYMYILELRATYEGILNTLLAAGGREDELGAIGPM